MFNNLEQELISFISAQNAEICLSLAYPRLDYYFGRNDDLQIHAASTMKLPVMIEVFRQAQSGRLSMDDQIPVHNAFRSIVDGSIFHLDAGEDSEGELYHKIGSVEKVRHLVTGMITSSGNLATNLLIELVGIENIRQIVAQAGAAGMSVLRGVEDTKAFRQGRNNLTTALALTHLFEQIAANTLPGIRDAGPLVEILIGQKFSRGLPAQLPKNLSVAHKTGWITGHNHDAGIIYISENNWYVLSILTRGFEDRDQAESCIAHMSRIIFDQLNM